MRSRRLKPPGHHDTLKLQLKTVYNIFSLQSLTFTNVRDLKPPQGGHVYGEAQYAYHTATNINGQKTEDAGGHKIINNDGKVKEFDFTPKPKFGPVSYF